MRAHLILAGGRILPLGGFGLRSASHLAVAFGKVIAVGGEEVLGLRGQGTRILSLDGATVLPGFNDPHAHVVYWGLSSFGVDLTGSRSIAHLLGRLRSAADRLPEGAWCLGRGYSEQELAEGRAPTRAELDSATGGRPSFVDHRGGHSRVANSAALAAAGLGPGTPDPPGGELGRDAEGKLTGFLGEAAMRMVADHQPPPSFAQRLRGIERCQRLLLSRGITSVGAAVNRGFADDLRAYQVLAETGRLRIRVNEFLSWELLPALAELGIASRSGSGLVRAGPVKVFVDGGASTGTAALRAGGGTWRTPPAELAALLGRAERAGLQVAAHCIGDAAVEAMADAVEAAQGGRPGRLRHRVEHCSLCPPDLQKRLAGLGMQAVMQPLFGTRGRERFARELDPGLVPHLAAHRALLAAGVPVSFSSDLPVTADPNPWLGIAAARSGPAPITLRQALHAYTGAGAFSSFEERLKGSLEVGRHADFQVYTGDPLSRPSPVPRPRSVYLDGRPVYSG